MPELTSGLGPLFTDPDPDAARAFFREKPRALINKVMSVKDAVAKLIHDGDYLASGGFGVNRISTAVLHEILRQRRRNLGFAGHTTTHDFEIMCAGNLDGEKLLARVDASYIVGLEARGLSPHARRVMQSGEVDVCEWSNYALACRFRAAVTGVPFVPIRSMLGTDTLKRSAGKEIVCPFTGKKLVAIPALYPDVSFIHVHECDAYGNCRIKGITVADVDLARCSKRLIITTERIVSNEEIRNTPYWTTIPSFCVDAVCEVPYGSYPGNMPGEYFSDEAHLREWLEVEKDLDAFRAFLKKYIYDVPDFDSYLRLCGGVEKMKQLRAKELLLPSA
ncbi:MAG: glutaconate CoA-transferase [Lentisphaerae bacterium RIFOXYB12_FULL_65_16]|nr:MAG: glutaconate CoA-transferase [Lentisphaerae bacterium RIFOXYA12_64_32]OGV88934.1 MAG: glutaconate CoA-transferase [Lentisphaerae bacterium RIFOXYB12_FULL_65_16]